MPMCERVCRGVLTPKVLQGWTLLQRGTHSGLWSQGHPLYRHKEVAAGVWWVEEKYFASSWNLANIPGFIARVKAKGKTKGRPKAK